MVHSLRGTPLTTKAYPTELPFASSARVLLPFSTHIPTSHVPEPGLPVALAATRERVFAAVRVVAAPPPFWSRGMGVLAVVGDTQTVIDAGAVPLLVAS